MFKAVIFDFDGVILNSEPLHYEACLKVFQPFEITLSYDEYLKDYLGLQDKDIFKRVFLKHNRLLTDDEILDLSKKKIHNYLQIIQHCEELPLIDDVAKFIKEISKQIPKIAICSNSHRNEIMTVLTRFDNGKLLPIFKTIVTSEDVESGKPSPEGYLLAAKKLNVDPKDCMVVEDTPFGIKASKAAGMYVFGVKTSYSEPELHQADMVIEGFKNLIDIFK